MEKIQRNEKDRFSPLPKKLKLDISLALMTKSHGM